MLSRERTIRPTLPHAPRTHAWGALQVVPQAPQSVVALWVFTQRPAHNVMPAWHTKPAVLGS